MESKPREVVEYKIEDGSSPFQKWLAGLRDVRARALIRKRLIRVRQGNLGDWHSVGDGVKEIKVAFGPGYRIYLQDGDIKKAQEYWADYRR